MALEEIAVRSRTESGSGPARRLRKEGWVPAVIYGHGKAAESLAIERRGIEKIINAHHRVVGLTSEGGGDSRRAFIKEVQYNPINDNVTHVDFVEVTEHEKIDVIVPLVFRGEAAGAKDGGALQILLHELEIECPADQMLEELRVNVSDLQLGDMMHVSDLALPEGSIAVTPPETAVAGCRRPKGEAEEATEAEAGESADAEAAPAQPEVISEKKREEREKEKDGD